MTRTDKYVDVAFSIKDIPCLVIRTSMEAPPGEPSAVAMPPDMIPWKRSVSCTPSWGREQATALEPSRRAHLCWESHSVFSEIRFCLWSIFEPALTYETKRAMY